MTAEEMRLKPAAIKMIKILRHRSSKSITVESVHARLLQDMRDVGLVAIDHRYVLNRVAYYRYVLTTAGAEVIL